MFTGCAGWPGCNFTEPYDDVIEALSARIDELECELAAARSARAALPADVLAKAIREIVVIAHPDKWNQHDLAHQVTARLNDLRTRLTA